MQDRIDYLTVHQMREHRRLCFHTSVAARRITCARSTDNSRGTSFSMLLWSERPPVAILSTILVAAANSVRSAESP
jgi:hypothetical protein